MIAIFLLLSTTALSAKKATFLLSNGAEESRISIKASGRRALIEGDEKYYAVIDLADSDDERTVYIVDREAKYYIPLNYRDIQALIAVKRMFMPKQESDNLSIISKNEIQVRGGFKSLVFSAEYEDAPVELEFSKAAAEELNEGFRYDDMIKFLNSIDFSFLGIGNESLKIIQSFLSHSAENGLIARVNIFDIDVVMLESIEDIELEESAFDIDEDFERATLERIVGLI